MPELWLKTADAARHLAVSRSYLKRCRIEYDGGFLLPRKHYILGASKTDPRDHRRLLRSGALVAFFYREGPNDAVIDSLNYF